MTSTALALAAALTVGIGLAHSWLGERRLIQPLLAPEHRHGVLTRSFSRRVLRFAWHITTLAWWGLAAILAIMAAGPGSPQSHAILKVIAVVFLVSGALTLVQSVEVGFIPRSLAVDPSGRFLASAIQGDGVIHIHAIAPEDGRLRHHATYETGGTPIWVEFVALP